MRVLCCFSLIVSVALDATESFMMQPSRSATSSTRTSSRKAQESKVTDWVVENLESEDSKITTASSTKAGENDTLPLEGLGIGNFRILAADAPVAEGADGLQPIRLLLGRNGWGTGVHPSTRLCLEYLSQDDLIQGGELFLDYGCGSGILSIGALTAGCSRAIGVDVEAEALVTFERNLILNGFSDGTFEALHTREVVPYGLCRPTGADICIANILVGQLTRPSMVSALSSNIIPDGLLVMSGIRPAEVGSLKAAYGENFDWIEKDYAELAAKDCEASLDSYGFDCGIWARLVGRRKRGDRKTDIERMSELAVS